MKKEKVKEKKRKKTKRKKSRKEAMKLMKILNEKPFTIKGNVKKKSSLAG